MRNGTLILASLLALTLLGAPALAGDGDGHGDEKKGAQAMQTTARYGQDFIPELHQADQLIGARVKNTQGEKLGEISDLVMDPDRGGVRYAIVAFGGVMGLGETENAVPWAEFEIRDPGMDMDDPHVVLDASKDELETYTSVAMKGDQMKTRRISGVLGKTVDDARNARLGEIEDVLIDVNKGHLAYAIVDVSDAETDMGDTKLVAVPWTSLNRHEQDYAVSMNAETLRQMTHEEGSLALLEDREKAEKRHRMARCEPYWTVAYWATLVPAGETTGEEPTRYGAMGDMATLTGEVTRVFGEMVNGREHLRLEVTTDDGKPYTVDAGLRRPDELDLTTFSYGDEVTVSGVEHTLGRGQTLVLANTIYADGNMHEVMRARDTKPGAPGMPHHED